MSAWLVLPAALVLALALTGLLRRFALQRKLLDIPNHRSSHSLPTPRGGGLAIVVSFLLGLVAFHLQNTIELSAFLALGGSGVLVALIGFMDDLGHVAARWRLLGHFGAAILGLYCLGGMPELTLAGIVFETGLLTGALGTLYLVWLLNLYNFMDGIDGIASVEAVTVCAGAAVLYYLSGGVASILPVLLLALSAIGFLAWNLPPAKIFMGDAGSGFVGMTLGILSVQAGWYDPLFFWGWLILLGVFVVDATVTLGRRLLRGEKVYEAHRSHAYQHAAQRYGNHKVVTGGVAVINIVWLLPFSILVTSGMLEPWIGLIISYAPLVLLAFRFNAGRHNVRD